MKANAQILASRADFWQREAGLHADASRQAAGRVYSVLSFGIAAVSAMVGAAIYTTTSLLLAFAPLAALFMFALIIRATIESLYESGFQAIADRRLRDVLAQLGDEGYPMWRAKGFESETLQRFNSTAWVIGGLCLTTMAAITEAASIYTSWPGLSADGQPIWAQGPVVWQIYLSTLGVVVTAAIVIVASILLALRTAKVSRELDQFLMDPDSLGSHVPKRMNGVASLEA